MTNGAGPAEAEAVIATTKGPNVLAAGVIGMTIGEAVAAIGTKAAMRKIPFRAGLNAGAAVTIGDAMTKRKKGVRAAEANVTNVRGVRKGTGTRLNGLAAVRAILTMTRATADRRGGVTTT